MLIYVHLPKYKLYINNATKIHRTDSAIIKDIFLEKKFIIKYKENGSKK